MSDNEPQPVPARAAGQKMLEAVDHLKCTQCQEDIPYSVRLVYWVHAETGQFVTVTAHVESTDAEAHAMIHKMEGETPDGTTTQE